MSYTLLNAALWPDKFRTWIVWTGLRSRIVKLWNRYTHQEKLECAWVFQQQQLLHKAWLHCKIPHKIFTSFIIASREHVNNRHMQIHKSLSGTKCLNMSPWNGRWRIKGGNQKSEPGRVKVLMVHSIAVPH